MGSRLDAEYKSVQRGKETADFRALKPRDLSSYIEAAHHSYLRIALPQIGELFGVVLKAHGKNHAGLFELAPHFQPVKRGSGTASCQGRDNAVSRNRRKFVGRGQKPVT